MVTKISVAALTRCADSKGCLKGAFVGGVAGHYAGHHGLLGAAAGCILGRREAEKHERQRMHDEASIREQKNGEERL
jgi:hypothetical protein